MMCFFLHNNKCKFLPLQPASRWPLSTAASTSRPLRASTTTSTSCWWECWRRFSCAASPRSPWILTLTTRRVPQRASRCWTCFWRKSGVTTTSPSPAATCTSSDETVSFERLGRRYLWSCEKQWWIYTIDICGLWAIFRLEKSPCLFDLTIEICGSNQRQPPEWLFLKFFIPSSKTYLRFFSNACVCPIFIKDVRFFSP